MEEYDGLEAEPGTIQAVLFSRTGLDRGGEHVLVSCSDFRESGRKCLTGSVVDAHECRG